MSTTLHPTADPLRHASSLGAAALLGRVTLALIFLTSGYSKLTGTAGTIAYMKSAGIPAADLLIWPTIAVELIGGLLLVIGWKARPAALVLALFTLVAGLIFHAFWSVPADQTMNQQIHFMKNLAIFGGLLMVFALGPGRLALERSGDLPRGSSY